MMIQYFKYFKSEYIWHILFLCILSILLYKNYILKNEFSCAGSDSYGYVSAAYRLLDLQLISEDPFFKAFPDDKLSFVPLGYTLSKDEAHSAPLYPLGVSVLMAIMVFLFGETGPYLLNPILAILCLWALYFLAKALFNSYVGIIAFCFFGVNYSYLISAIAPMSDMACVTFFVLAVLLLYSEKDFNYILSGFSLSFCFFVRPSSLIFYIPFLILAFTKNKSLYFISGLLPITIIVSLFNYFLYGNVFTFGYMFAEKLLVKYGYKVNMFKFFSFDSFLPNILMYLSNIYNDFGLIFCILIFIGLIKKSKIPFKLFIGSLFLINLIFYSFYNIHDTFHCRRFILPGLAMLSIVSAAGLYNIFTLLLRKKWIITIGSILFIKLLTDQFVVNLNKCWTWPDVSIAAANYINKSCPKNALILSCYFSGSMNYYTGRKTVREDLIKPRTLGLLNKRLPLYIMLETTEANLLENKLRSKYLQKGNHYILYKVLKSESKICL